MGLRIDGVKDAQIGVLGIHAWAAVSAPLKRFLNSLFAEQGILAVLGPIPYGVYRELRDGLLARLMKPKSVAAELSFNTNVISDCKMRIQISAAEESGIPAPGLIRQITSG